MEIHVNGKREVIDDGQTLADLLRRLDVRTDGGIAVALNDAVVPRGRWASSRLRPGDSIEVIEAVQGG